MRQGSARDHAGAHTKLHPWDLALNLEWGGLHSKTGSPEEPSYCHAQPCLGPSSSCREMQV